MPFSFPVLMQDGTLYNVRELLGKAESNVKLSKSEKAGKNIMTVGLSLAPAHASGFNLCTSASKACVNACLFTAGMAQLNPRMILPARIAKARMLRLHKDDFISRLRFELGKAVIRAARKDMELYVRLNVVSDVMWEREFPTLMPDFAGVQFYDYTKHYKRMLRYLAGDLPANYHLTFSYSGTNESESLDILNRGGNVTVVFDVKYLGEKRRPLPATWNGYPIIDGDITDLRPLDPTGGYVVGLRAKGKARKDKTSGFVVLEGGSL